MRKILSLVVAACVALCCSAGFAEGRIVEPTVEKAVSAGPQPENYILDDTKNYAVGYKDPTLEITITDGRYLDTTWTAARIKIAYPAQLRTAMCHDRYGSGSANGEYVSAYAERKNAVFAINDDWFMSQYRQNVGCVIRQGNLYRLRCDESKNRYDILAIDDQGDFHALQHATNDDIRNFDGRIVNAFVFGPAVVVDYQAQPVAEDNQMGAFHKAQRMGIGQIGPLEYICLCCEGPEDPGSTGLTVEEFGQLAASFGDVRIFYNLDGGSSATMVFKGVTRYGRETLWAKINAPMNNKVRPTGGAIYFISAWVPEGQEGITIEEATP